LSGCDGLLDVGNQLVLVRVAGDAWEGLGSWVGELPRPCLESEGSTGETGVVSESCNTATTVVSEELKVEKGSATTWEASKDLLPTTLLLVAMGELNVNVLERD
jgi:hypothetical protein